MLLPNNLTARIDEYIYRKLPNETPAYQSMLRERLLDLCRRDVSLSDASAYLKSGGWSLDFCVYYKELLAELAQEVTKEQKETKMDDSINLTFTADQVQQLLCALASDFAEAAGFRAKAENESGKEYREAVKQFLRGREAGATLDPEVLDLMITQLTDVKETAAAHIAFYRELKK